MLKYSLCLFADLGHVFEGVLNQLLQRGQVNVIEPVDIQTRLSRLMLAQFLQEFIALFETRHDIEREVLLAGRKADQARVAFVSTGVGIVIAAKANDAAAPHSGFGFCDLLHELDEGEAILPFLLIGNVLQETVNAVLVQFGFEFCHDGVESPSLTL